ncbi:hypothetical protein [Flavobacterium aquatile]|uniref:Uncharacterized protein n=1 Tax=Flavobacterium aquatile LMG 4008 = ATCC 11947 TaxID=1453498 RepID=A0A095TZ51_9FLAO|nr:hypothetical protein [Flavobacterium aquatile]KGD67633.1 hypothetical protein LG45_10945 [Flavobacterium aquatile LMG 4008 = ATCC 11947]OXA67500.1 hypothetical protein B0A61_06685 [Flavobacterium aquatile LMG 4008 = ATCC 11947]GEC79165.1 hypothetical protein FAQ01_20350 [Flavobacterium aquatile]
MNNFKLDNEPKIKSGFQIPDNYFDTFSEKVMNQLPTEEPKIISLWDRNKRWVYSVAAILVLSLTIPLANQFQSTTTEIATTETNEIENYLAYHASLSDEEIIKLLDKEDIAEIEITNSLDEEALKQALYEDSNTEYYITN